MASCLALSLYDEMGAKIEEWYNIFAPIYEEYLK